MAVDTPILENKTVEKKLREIVPARMTNLTEEEHNARIKETYARLINPEYNRVDEVFNNTQAPVAAPVQLTIPVAQPERPYLVENARATAAIFRADSRINAVSAPSAQAVATVESEYVEEENEDLRPTPTTIQYQTIGKVAAEEKVAAVSRAHAFGKREKTLLAAFVAIVMTLITLIIVNSAIISHLNRDIATVDTRIETVKDSIEIVNNDIENTIMSGLNS